MSAVPRPVVAAVEALVKKMVAGDYTPTPIIDLGALIANADGVVDAEEIDTLRRILEPMLGAEVPAEVVKFLIDASVHVIKAAGVDARLRLVAEIMLDCDAAEPALEVALGVAFASVGYSDAERAVVEKLAATMNVAPDRLAPLVDKMRASYHDIPPASAKKRSNEPSGMRS
jgi:tellurite resistance protein